MNIFEYVTAILLLVLGLGITNLLTDAVNVFRARRSIEFHWVPLAWVGLIFAWQMQFLWAVFELNMLIESWTALKFIVFLCLALLLFVAGTLIVPSASDDDAPDVWEQFNQDGRWSLVFLAVYFLVAFFVNPAFFDVPVFSPLNLLALLLGIILIIAMFIRSKRVWIWVTIGYSILSLVAIVYFSPMSYHV